MILTGRAAVFGEKACPSSFYPPQSHKDWSENEPAFRGEKPVIILLRHNTVQ
jgi:hypothetical protein